LPEFWSPPAASDPSIKKEDATLPSPIGPRTPIQRRTKSMFSWSPYSRSPGKSDTRPCRATPLLTSIAICEENCSVHKPDKTSSSDSPPRTPILRVSRRKRPCRTLASTPRASVLMPSDKTNQTCGPASTFKFARSLKELVKHHPGSKQDSRLVLVDGNDQGTITMIRDEIARLRAIQGEQREPIRLVDSRIFPRDGLSDYVVDKYTLCII
jgi:hypothetical protein